MVAKHASDLVMFDVPPPENGVRGRRLPRLVAALLRVAEEGAAFEIVEIDVTAGADVAYAWALLRCGKQDELGQSPDTRLRLTIGLRKQAGGWVIAHEHHSFTAKD